MSLQATHPLSWYTARIGTSVYRKPGKMDVCRCGLCLEKFRKPHPITDAKEAERLFEMEYEMGYEFFETVQI